MDHSESTKIVGNVLLVAGLFVGIVWSAATMGFWPDLRDKDKQVKSSLDMHKKHSPLWWQKTTRWFLLIAFVLVVTGMFLGGGSDWQMTKREPFWNLFGRGK